MSIIRFRVPPTESLRDALLEAADRALRRRGCSEHFREVVKCSLEQDLRAAAHTTALVEFDEWPEWATLGETTRAEIEPFIRRFADAAATRTFEVFAVRLLLPQIVQNVTTLFSAREAGLAVRMPGDETPPIPRGGGKAA